MPPVLPEPPVQTEHIRDVPPEECTYLGLGFAMELGYTIAVPAVLFALVGRYIDKYFQTTPAFLLLGIVLACAISCATVFRKLRQITRRMPKRLPTPPDQDIKKVSEAFDFHEQFRPPSAQ